jgi:transposase
LEIDPILLLTAFAGGYLVSHWQCRHHLLINLALRAELIDMRRKVHCNQSDKTSKVPPYKRKLSRRHPRMPWWKKAFLGFLKRFCPRAVSYNQFHPKTLESWAKKLFLPSTYIALLKKWAKKQKIRKDCTKAKRRPGRPSTPQYVVDIILAMKKENPGYSPGMISRMLKSQLDISIHKKTVQAILKNNGYPPNPPGKIHPPKKEPSWKALINNQFVAAIDFKNITDLWGNQMFILNIIDHGRRHLFRSTATYHPTALWVAQQIREAFPYDTAPETIVMDRDSLFLSLVKQTLPNMGIKVRRIDYKCPWQNGVVERFNLTLQAELLSLITAVNLTHINKLLRQYREYYNTVRPHMTNDDFPPDAPENKPVIIPFPERKLENVNSVSWVGGFHHSYYWAA